MAHARRTIGAEGAFKTANPRIAFRRRGGLAFLTFSFHLKHGLAPTDMDIEVELAAYDEINWLYQKSQ